MIQFHLFFVSMIFHLIDSTYHSVHCFMYHLSKCHRMINIIVQHTKILLNETYEIIQYTLRSAEAAFPFIKISSRPHTHFKSSARAVLRKFDKNSYKKKIRIFFWSGWKAELITYIERKKEDRDLDISSLCKWRSPFL